jgi:uncharacterized protein YodC (DUF2158 family)
MTLDMSTSSTSSFKEGDIVQLKSGGPWMTMVSLSDKDNHRAMATCAWFDDANEKSSFFKESCLRLKVKKDPPIDMGFVLERMGILPADLEGKIAADDLRGPLTNLFEDEFATIIRKVYRKKYGVLRSSRRHDILDRAKLVKGSIPFGAPCDGSCAGDELGDCSHERYLDESAYLRHGPLRDFLDEVIAERTKGNTGFPKLVIKKAKARRKLTAKGEPKARRQ